MGDQAKPGRLARLRRRYEWLDRLVRAAGRYESQYGDYYAAAITYFSVLALVPLLMIAFAVAGFVLSGDPELLAQLQRSITRSVPNEQLGGMLNSVVNESIARAGAVGLIGLLFALYSGLSWMTSMREALTALWPQGPTSPPLLKRTVSDLVSLIGLGAAMAISFGISAVGSGVGRQLFAIAGFRNTLEAAVGLRVLTIALSLAAGWLVFLWILARLPRTPVRIRDAVWGALFAAVGFEILKQIGVLYLRSVTDSPSGAVFGPILGLLVFVFLTSRFLLFAAAWTASTRENEEYVPPSAPSPAVIRPVVARGPSAGTGARLLGIGVVLGWVLRSRFVYRIVYGTRKKGNS